MKRLFAVIASGRHAARNRLAVMLSYLAGLRVGEIAALMVHDVVDGEDQVRDQVRLNPAYTKGGVGRTVFVNKRLKREIAQYFASLSALPTSVSPLLPTQKRTAFSANTLCQLFGELYRRAGIDGASSHSGRRSAITKLSHAGISAKVIMEIFGHRNLATVQRYIDVNDEMKRAAVEVLKLKNMV